MRLENGKWKRETGKWRGRCWSIFLFPFPLFLVLAAAGCHAIPGQRPAAQQDFTPLREEMVREQIAAERWSGAPAVRNARVLAAMRKVPRHRFVPPSEVASAYGDHPLPIGHGQTISQPYIVAIMTEAVEPRAGHRALEIGTGSGYQAAVLAEVVKEVFTIEIVEPLGREARDRLRALSYKNIEVRIGDGYAGWPEKAPFDVIVVTAGAPHVPPALVEQLKPGGRMVIPVGEPGAVQQLRLVSKSQRGEVRSETLMDVRFVPLVRAKP